VFELTQYQSLNLSLDFVAKLFIPSLKRIYKAQEEILQSGMQKELRPCQEKMMKSILHTHKGMKIGGNTIKELMDTEEYHQGERNECNANTYLQHKGRPTRLTSTQDQEYDEDDDPYWQGLEESTYDSDQECQEHDDRYGNQDIPQEDEDDHGYQDQMMINKKVKPTTTLIDKKVIRKKVKHMTKMIRVMNTTALRKLVNYTLPG